MDHVDGDDRFAFRFGSRVPWGLRLRRMTPERSSVVITAEQLEIRAGTWWEDIPLDDIARVTVIEWPDRARPGIHRRLPGTWLVAAAPGRLAAVERRPRAEVTIPRIDRLDLGLVDPDAFAERLTRRAAAR